MTDAEKARRVLELWEREPLRMVVDELKVQPDAFQVELCQAFGKHQLAAKPQIALKSCKGPGKTAGLSWCMLNFLVTRGLLYPQHNTKLGATSITGDNIDANLWPELNKWIARSEFLTRTLAWSSTRVVLRDRPSQVFAERRAWPKKADAQQQADALAGFHADHVGFILDESGGIPQAVMVTAEAVLATEGQEAFILQAGNPTHVEGPLHRACTVEAHLWRVITITGDPDDPRRSARISLKWAKEQIAKWGRENPWVKVNVLGQFPPASINALLGIEDVEAAMRRHHRRDAFDWAQKRLGVDAARFGDDPWVISPRQGLAAFRPVVMRNPRTTDVAARIAKAHRDWGAELILVDDTGHWGHGCIDILVTAGLPVVPIIYSERALDRRYKTRRDEMHLTLADWVKNGGALYDDIELKQELITPTYTFVGGVFVLEDKDQIKERLGRSPNKADALAQTFAMPEAPGDLMARLRGRTTTLHDGDPFARQRMEDLEARGRAALQDDDPYRGI